MSGAEPGGAPVGRVAAFVPIDARDGVSSTRPRSPS
jgi:hypothetical protein